MAQNDWIVAGLNNPTFTTSDFADIADMTVDNTQMLSMDEYLKSDFIKNNSAFADSNGNFSEQKFADYYQARLAEFGDFQNQNFQKGPALSMFDILRTPDTPIRDTKFNVQRGFNPDRQQIGIEGVNIISDPRFSKREIAKQNRVYNYEEERFEDYTPDERVLTKSPLKWLKDMFSEPLVMATWDDDGTHIDPLTGMEQEHHKGEYKLNDKGTYYYETLGGRSPIGKDVLNWNDTLTVDGQGVNKYDFFDSNDLKKSAGGIIGRAVASLVPLFCGPMVGGVYTTALIARELTKSLPMLYGMVTAFNENDSPQWLNEIAAYAQRASTSQADYDKEHMFSFGNIANTLSDVATQWSQQMQIAKVFGSMRGSQKIIEEAREKALALYDVKKMTLGESPELLSACMNKFMPAAEKAAQHAGQLGRDMSLVYMAVISNQDVYEDMLERGSSKKDAALVALGSSLGMFAVDKYLGLGELFFDDGTPTMTKQARKAIKDEIAAVSDQFDKIAGSSATLQNKFFGFLRTASDAGKRAMSKFAEDLKYHTTSMGEKMLGEGLEEVMEEVVADFTKQLYQWAGDLGANTSINDAGAWDNAFDRYMMNFLGGFMGGGVFYGKQVWDSGTFHRPHMDIDIATVIRNGGVNELRNQLALLDRDGKTGSRKLSASPDDVTEMENGNRVWLTTNDESKSQASAITAAVNDRINQIEEVLLTERNANMSDDELFENMVMSEKRYTRYRGISGLTPYYEMYGNILQQLVNARLNYKQGEGTVTGLKGGASLGDKGVGALTPEQQDVRSQNLKAQEQTIADARKKLEDFLSGDMSLRYTRMLNFAMDYNLFSPFVHLSVDQYAQDTYGKPYVALTEDERKEFAGKWQEYVARELPTKLTAAFDSFELFENQVAPHLSEVEKTAPEYRAWVQDTQKLLKSGLLSQKGYEQGLLLGRDVRIEGETDEDYEYRNKKKEGETDDEYQTRVNNRKARIEALNDEHDEKWAAQVSAELDKVGWRVDPHTARLIKTALINRNRMRDIIFRKVRAAGVGSVVIGVFRAVDLDLKNLDSLKQSVRDNTRKTTAVDMWERLWDLYGLNLTTVETKTEENGERTTTKGQRTLKELTQILDVEDTPLTGLLNLVNNPDTIMSHRLTDESRILLAVKLASVVNSEFIPSDMVKNWSIGMLSDIEQFGGIEEYLNLMDDDGSMRKEIDSNIDSVAGRLSDVHIRNIDSIAESIRNNPVYQLQSRLKTDITNPIAVLIQGISQEGGADLGNVEEILRVVQDNFDNLENIGQLRLDDTQREQLEKIRDYLELTIVYTKAASTVPTMEAPVGHNKSINAFAESHKDKLTKEWKRLPEIDSDLATLYIQCMNEYIKEINTWIHISDINQADKINAIAATEPAVLNAMAKVWRKTTSEFTLNISGKKYNLMDGMDSIDFSGLENENAQAVVYKLETIAYNNAKKIAAENNMTVADLVKNSNLLETVIPTLKGLPNQINSALDEFTQDSVFTDYTTLQYVLSVLSEDPTVYYSRLLDRINKTPDKVPNINQDIGSRIMQAFRTQTYKDMWRHASSMLKLPASTPILYNTAMVEGGAGVGKTEVQLLSALDTCGDVPIVISGPTMVQADKLSKRLGRGTAMSKEDLFRMLFGDDQIFGSDGQPKFLDVIKNGSGSNTYFKIVEGEDKLAKIVWNEGSLKPVVPKVIPKVIAFDEATHLSTAEAIALDRAAVELGITVYYAGCLTQNGYANTVNGMQNIDEGAVLMVRSPKLTLSMRNGNLPKINNENIIYRLAEEVRQKRLYSTEAEYQESFSTFANLLKATSLSAYTGDELNGDLIIPELSDSTIDLLKRSVKGDQKLAFIGDNPESSTNLSKLRAAGIPVETILDFKEMQGQEFAFVVVDHQFTNVEDITSLRLFVNDLYTAISRAEVGTVLLDRGLSEVLGPMRYTKYKVAAPSIREGLEKLRTQRIAALRSLNLSQITTETTTKEKEVNADEEETEEKPKEETEEKKPEEPEEEETQEPPTPGVETAEPAEPSSDPDTEYNPVEDEPKSDLSTGRLFEDPDIANEDPEAKDIVDEMVKEDQESDQGSSGNEPPVNTAVLDFNNAYVPAYADATPLGITEDEHPSKIGNTDAVAKKWHVKVSKDDTIRRNLQAIVSPTSSPTSKVAHSMKTKLKWERMLEQVKSYLAYDHTWDDAPDFITRNFTEKDWNNGKIQLEIRRVEDGDRYQIYKTGEVEKGQRRLPNRLYEFGMDYAGDGKLKVHYNLVYTVQDKNGITCRFDLAAVNNPKTLIRMMPQILSGMQTELANIQDPNSDRAKRLRGMLSDGSSSLQKNAVLYQQWFEEQLAKLDTQDSVVIDLPEGAASSQAYTAMRRRLDKIHFSGDLSWYDKTPNARLHTMTEVNPHIVYSRLYTFTGRDCKELGLSMSLKGRMGVFASNDTLLKGDDLCNLYVRQKTNRDMNTPRVRFIPLDNFGVSIWDICNPEYSAEFLGDSQMALPFDQSFTGVRMFASLWNARASLIQLNNAISSWRTDYVTSSGNIITKLSDAQIDAMLEVQYYMSPSAQKVRSVQDLQQHVLDPVFGAGVETVAHAAKAVNDFNNITCVNIPMFRLGYYYNATRGRNKGLHMQSVTIKNEKSSQRPIYADGNHVMCFLTRGKAEQFFDMLDTIMTSISTVDTNGFKNNPSGSGSPLSLEVIMTKDTYDADGNVIESVPWNPAELIDINDDKHRLTLSGMITRDKTSSQMKLVFPKDAYSDGKEVPVLKGMYWSYIPRLLQEYVWGINRWNTEGNYDAARKTVTNGRSLNRHINVKAYNGVQAKEPSYSKSVVLNVDRFFRAGLINDPAIGGIDNSLTDMLSVIFHGTIDDIHGKDTIKMELAYFPDGFEINPDATMSLTERQRLQVRNTQGEVLFYALNTPGVYGLCDVDLLGPGWNVSILALINPEQFEKNKTLTVSQEQEQTAHRTELTPEDEQFIDDMFDQLSQDFPKTPEGLAEAIEVYNSMQDEALNRSVRDGSLDLDTPFRYSNGKYLTFREWLVQQGAEPSSIAVVGDHLEFTVRGERMSINFETMEISQDGESVVTGAPVLSAKYDGSTIFEALRNLVQTDEFRDIVGDDEEINNFIKELDRIVDITDPDEANNEFLTLYNGLSDNFTDALYDLAKELDDKLNECFGNG